MLVDKKKRDDDDDGLLLVNNGLSKESGEVVPIIINGLVDIIDINMRNINGDDMERFLFGYLEAAYLFYYWYARNNGFFLLGETKL